MRTELKTSRQTGATLVVSLLLLLVMTLLGLTAMQVTRMEERMAGNTRDINIAFQGAEAVLRDAEDRVRLMVARPDTCSIAPCIVWQKNVAPADLRNQLQSWWDTNATEYGLVGTQDIAYTAREPQAVTEELGFISDSLTMGHGPPEGRDFYRVTAHSSGGSDAAQAVLETTYTRRF